MISDMKKILCIAVFALWAAPSLACDGIPPKLVNKDDKSYDYELICGKKTEKHTIGAKATQELDEKSGCKLKLGDNKAKKLYTEMVCTIKEGKLSCDLL